MRLSLQTINKEMAKRGYAARLEKGTGYFYFHFGEAADWLDRTVKVRKINDLTLKQWMAEFDRLAALNKQIMRTVRPSGAPGTADDESAAQPKTRKGS